MGKVNLDTASAQRYRTQPTRMRWARWLAVAASLAVLAGCDTARTAVTPVANTSALSADEVLKTTECRACHGSTNNAAPPRGLKGQTATTDVGVGAHQQHLAFGPAHEPIACETCHVVPTSKYQKGHLDAADERATVTFSGLALANNATASAYDPKANTCSVYCHGNTLKSPGKDSKPLWTKVDGSQRGCDSCHGAPPPAPHPKDNNCKGCHAATMGEAQAIYDGIFREKTASSKGYKEVSLASSSSKVPVTFVRTKEKGSSIERSTWVSAAKFTTAAGRCSRNSARTASRSAMSASTKA